MDYVALTKRIKELELAMEQCMANFNMLQGGKEEILHWLKQIDAQQVLQD